MRPASPSHGENRGSSRLGSAIKIKNLSLPGKFGVPVVSRPKNDGERMRWASICRSTMCALARFEQLTLNQRVQGSSPCAPTNKFNYLVLNLPTKQDPI